MPLSKAQELELLELEEAEYQASNASAPSAFRSAMDATAMPFSPPLLKAISEPESAKAFGRGALSGATFGMAGKTGLEGSVMEPRPTARKMGEFAGFIVPIIASELTGGAALGAGAAARGAGALGRTVMTGVGTGATYEGIKGAALRTPPLQTIEKAVDTGLVFGGFNAAGQGLGYLRKVFGEKMAESVANHFINTDKKIAEKLYEQGNPSLGKQYLKTDLPGFKNRDEVYAQTGKALSESESKIKGILKNSKGTISTRDVANELDDVAEKFKTGTHRTEVVDVGTKKGQFLEDNPDNLSLEEAMKLKRKLDDRVSKAYLALDSAKTPANTEIDEALANGLRKRIYELNPKLGELAAQESLMIRIRTGLLPEVAKRGGSRLPFGLYSTIVNALEGSPASNALAKGLHKGLGTPSRIIAPGVGLAAKTQYTVPQLQEDR